MNCRWLTKWIKRIAFRKGKNYTENAIKLFSVKYMTKYLLKRQKLGLDTLKSKAQAKEISKKGFNLLKNDVNFMEYQNDLQLRSFFLIR